MLCNGLRMHLAWLMVFWCAANLGGVLSLAPITLPFARSRTMVAPPVLGWSITGLESNDGDVRKRSAISKRSFRIRTVTSHHCAQSAMMMAPLLFSQSVSSSTSSSSRQVTVFSRMQQWWLRIFYAIRRWIQNSMWRGTAPDSQYSDYPLPLGSFRCPLRRYGFDIRESTSKDGPGVFFKKQAASLGYPRVWKGLTKSKDPFVVISGAAKVKSVLRQEFDTLVSNAVIPFSAKIVGTNSIRFASNRQDHSFLRRLVGAGSSAEAVADAIPLLQQTAQDEVQQLIQQGSNHTAVCMEDVCHQFTLNVAWRQILGLQLDEAEVPIFLDNVRDWLTGLFSPASMDKSMAARVYLVSLIEDRMAELERNGPDGSTLGKMLFATDTEGEDTPRRLTRDQVIDNSLLLILAGSDTSAGTLTAALFSMGLHPSVWNNVVREQQELVARDGAALDKEQLDSKMPYLDAVVKETMRLFPIIGGSARATKETIIVDGEYQVPKNWAVLYDRWLTHRQDTVTFCDDGSHMDPVLGFQPERWLDDTTRPTSEYIPFGAGPRYCLGAELSLAEMKTFLAIMARNLDYELVHSREDGNAIEWKTQSLFQIPADGVAVKIQVRTVS